GQVLNGGLTRGGARTAGQLLGAHDVGVTRVRRQRLRPPAGSAPALIRICFIGGPFCPVPGPAARTCVSRLGGGCSLQSAVTVSACDLPAAGHCGTIGQRTPAWR